jgi:ABC-2 type transport system permease protein
MNHNILMLIRREIWEHRSLWIVPLVLAGVILIIGAFGGVHFSDGHNFNFGSSSHGDFSDLPPAERERLMAQMSPKEESRFVILGGAYSMLTVVQLVALGIVVFFYLLDSLLAERRDRSILFWKSLPVSDGEVVTSKALTALVVAPLLVVLVSAVLLPVLSGVVALRLGDLPFNPWSAEAWLKVQAVILGFVPMVVLWYLPLAGYLMVVSVWVRKNAFLWAVLPPVGLLLIEGMITHTNVVGRFLGERFGGFANVMEKGDLRHVEQLHPESAVLESYKLIGQVFADSQIWIGMAAGLALIYLATRIRRYRDDS